MKACNRGVVRSKWFLPATSVILGVVALAAFWLGGHSGSPYDWLGGIGGLSYLLATAYFRWRG